ncbi:MAG: hypothetical protein PHX70_01080 [Clostridium sp.]|nr:hypothetical protein [Clostridium sp.]
MKVTLQGLNGITLQDYYNKMTNKNTDKGANNKAQSNSQQVTIDTDNIYVEPIFYDNSSGKIETYDRNGNKVSYDGQLYNAEGAIADSIDKSINPNYVSDIADSSEIPAGGESLTDYDKQEPAIEAEDSKRQEAYEAYKNEYNGYSTPIADELDNTIKNLQTSNSNRTYNSPEGNADYLAISIVAYNKAKSQIEENYSEDSISKREQDNKVTDVASYTKEQENNKNAELNKLNDYFADDTAYNINSQTKSLESYITGKSLDGAFESTTSISIYGMEKELSSLYGQFSSENNVDYSKESVKDIANKFENYSYDKVKTTVNIAGADFTYKDLVSANKVLSMAVPSNYGVTGTSSDGNLDMFQFGLGASEVSYVAKNVMTSGAGKVLTDSYNSHLQDLENNSLLMSNTSNQIYLNFYKTLINCGDIEGAENFKNNMESLENIYNSFKSIDVSNEQSFKNGYQNAMNYMSNVYGEGGQNDYEQMQSNFNTFAAEFFK